MDFVVAGAAETDTRLPGWEKAITYIGTENRICPDIWRMEDAAFEQSK